MHINIEKVHGPGAAPPGTGFFFICHVITPQKTCHVTVRGTRHHKTQHKMRTRPEPNFCKAWATHYKAANLARLSDEEKLVEYSRFCTEWEEKMRRSPAH